MEPSRPSHQIMPSRPKKKRERATHSKTRTGCRTCKTRRIKCDETQPFCIRCISTGRTCDGYEPVNANARWVVVTPPSPSPSPPLATIPSSPTAYPECLLEDGFSKMSFDYFRTVSVPELSRFFGRSFWSQSLLNTSHQFPAVMSAMLALASLHRRFKDGTPLEGDVFAVRQYVKSLKQLIRAMASTSDRSHSRLMALLCGVLFSVIEVLQGKNLKALVHLDGIIRLLNEKPHQSTDTTEDVLIADTVMRDLKAVIFRFDIEGALYAIRRQPRLTLPPLPHAQLQPSPVPIQDLDQIEDDLNNLMAYMSQFTYKSHPYRYDIAGDVPFDILLEQQQLIAHFTRWWSSAETTLLDLSSDPKKAQQDEQTRRATLLRIHYHTSWTMLQCCVHPEETSYDQYLANFAEIVRCTALLSASDGLAKSPEPNEPRTTTPATIITRPAAPSRAAFSPETGIVFPLYWAAVRCRDGRLRRRALAQLRVCATEGVWIPEAQTKVAARIIEIEEGLERNSLLREIVFSPEEGKGEERELPKMDDIYEFRRCHRITWPADRVKRRVCLKYEWRPNGLDGEWESEMESVDY